MLFIGLVDSISRDGPDTPILQNANELKPSNFISLLSHIFMNFRQLSFQQIQERIKKPS